MSGKEEAKKRMQLLKLLREEHKDTVERTQALLKEQQATRKQIKNAMKPGPKTIPEIATETALPADKVLWYITAMKKYGLVNEVGMSGEYFQYELSQETK
jgi:predicted transcriptional regulator